MDAEGTTCFHNPLSINTRKAVGSSEKHSVKDIVQRQPIYRWGSHSPNNCTPRDKDKGKLSFNTEKPLKDKCFSVDSDKITGSLQVIFDPGTHVSVTTNPIDDKENWRRGQANKWTDELHSLPYKLYNNGKLIEQV